MTVQDRTRPAVVLAVCAALIAVPLATASDASATPQQARTIVKQAKVIKAQAKVIRTKARALRTCRVNRARLAGAMTLDLSTRYAILTPDEAFAAVGLIYARLAPLDTHDDWMLSSSYSEYGTFTSRSYSFYYSPPT